MPGTHTKWAAVAGESLQEFLTAPTGEIFATLCEHTVLVRDRTTSMVHVPLDFERGLAEAAKHPGLLLQQIFQARSLRLDQQLSPEGAASWISGLLIGADVKGALSLFAEHDADRRCAHHRRAPTHGLVCAGVESLRSQVRASWMVRTPRSRASAHVFREQERS